MWGTRRIHTVVLRTLGIVLLVAAALKAHQPATQPFRGDGMWGNRWLSAAQVEFEFVLGAWLFSGLLQRVAWLAALASLAFFSLVTFHEAPTGIESCGCFGAVRSRPWTAVTGLDLPAVLALILFRPAALCPQRFLLRLRRRRWPALIRRFLQPAPSQLRFFATAGLTLVVLGATTPILAFHKPAAATSTCEVLEPETWIGQELPRLQKRMARVRIRPFHVNPTIMHTAY
jgi:hypothetical protein